MVEYRGPNGFVWRRGTHYENIAIDSFAAVEGVFGSDDHDGELYEGNWLFLGTSGVHGTYAHPNDPDFWDPDVDGEGKPLPPMVTVLIVFPRIVSMRYGHIKVTREQAAKLVEWERRTAEEIASRNPAPASAEKEER